MRSSWFRVGIPALLVVVLVAGSVFAGPMAGGSKAKEIKKLDKNRETPPKIVKDKESMNRLAAILAKETLTERDYMEIRAILEKMENISIDDQAWVHLKDYIDSERAKKKWLIEKSKREREHKKDASATSVRAGILSINPQNHIPILVQQYPDLFGGFLYEGQNYADEVFYISNGLKTVDGIRVYEFEYTQVYRDEDAPWPWDGAYDDIRYANWGRWEDIETYYLYVYQNGTPWKFYFYYGEPVNNGIYSGSATYYTLPGPHIIAYVPWSSFSKSGDRPYIYVNTWNHALGENDNNPDMSNWVSAYAETQGSRVDAEIKYVDDCSLSPFC